MAKARRQHLRRSIALGALATAGAALVGTLAVVTHAPVDLRAGSVLSPSGASPVEVVRTPDAYRVVYREESHAGGDTVVSTEEIWVRRPFDGRVEERRGPPPGTELLTTTVSRLGVFAFRNEGAARPDVLFEVPPASAASDTPVTPALAGAIDQGLSERRERRRILALARDCQVYRFGRQLRSGTLVPIGSIEGEYVDACIDEAGLVLEEVWSVGGSILERRVAVDVDENAALDDGLFTPPSVEALDVLSGGGSARPIDPGSHPPGPFFEPSEIPASLERLGRFEVVPPQGGAFGDPLQQAGRLASVSDVYGRGPEFLVVDQGVLGGSGPFEPEPGAFPVDAGQVGPGELILGARFSEVRIVRDDGSFVRVYGTVPIELLLDVVRAIRPQPDLD